MAFVIILFCIRFLPLRMTRPVRHCRAGLANLVLNIGQRELTYTNIQETVIVSKLSQIKSEYLPSELVYVNSCAARPRTLGVFRYYKPLTSTRWGYNDLFIQQQKELKRIRNIEEGAYFNCRTCAWRVGSAFLSWTAHSLPWRENEG